MVRLSILFILLIATALEVRAGDSVRSRAGERDRPLPIPSIEALTPAAVDACAGEEPATVMIRGRDFRRETAVLVGGVRESARWLSSETLEVSLTPGRSAGVYGVKLQNPGAAPSVPASLYVRDIPQIESVEQGQDYVNYYEIIIRGANFYPRSILTVAAPDSDLPGMRSRPRILRGQKARPELGEQEYPPKRDRLLYRDCRTLIYQRYPADFQKEELRLQVVNPDGKTSAPFTVVLP